jgi:multidrug resistance protein
LTIFLLVDNLAPAGYLSAMKEASSEAPNELKTTAELSHSGHGIEEKLEEGSLTSSRSLKIHEHDRNLDHTTQKADNKTAGSADLESAPKPWSIQVDATGNAHIISWDSSSSDADNPLNWPTWRKWTLITLVSFITFMAGLSSSMFAPSVPALMTELHSTNSILGSFVVTVFVLGFATGPLLFAPLSEVYGRLLVQHIGSIGFLIFSVACALSKNLNTLIGMRLLQGIFAAAPLTNGGAIIADMIKQEERGFAMAMFTLGMLLGSVVGPVCGGFLAADKGWRWVFWVISIFVCSDSDRLIVAESQLNIPGCCHSHSRDYILERIIFSRSSRS